MRQILDDNFWFPKTRIDFHIHKCTFTSVSCTVVLGVDETHLGSIAIVVETRVHFCNHIKQCFRISEKENWQKLQRINLDNKKITVFLSCFWNRLKKRMGFKVGPLDFNVFRLSPLFLKQLLLIYVQKFRQNKVFYRLPNPGNELLTNKWQKVTARSKLLLVPEHCLPRYPGAQRQ